MTTTDVLSSTNADGLFATASLVSANGYYTFVIQSDGNLVIYACASPYNTVTWASGTSSSASPLNFKVQGDGNIVLYAAGTAIWASNTNGKGTAPYTLIMQGDGNLVLYDSTSTGIWDTATNGKAVCAKTEDLMSESAGQTLMQTFMPVVYFHKDEPYFPTKIESFPIDWSTVTTYNSDAVASWSNDFRGNTAIDQSVPIYTSIQEFNDGTCRISYLFLYGFNGAGPTLEMKNTILGGIGGTSSIDVGSYGFDQHYSDVEHIEVTLKSGYTTVDNIVYAYHSWRKTVAGTSVSYENGHPVVYVAKGSHSSWPTAGDQSYLQLWDEYKAYVYTTWAKLVDHCASSSSSGIRWYSTNPRLLKLNGNQMTTNSLSTAEIYVGFKYSGHMGPTYTAGSVTGLQAAIGNKYVNDVLKYVTSSIYDEINGWIYSDFWTSAMLQNTGSTGFYGRSF